MSALAVVFTVVAFAAVGAGAAQAQTLTVAVTGPGTVTSDPPGIACGTAGADCSEPYPKVCGYHCSLGHEPPVAQVVTLTATPDPGRFFGGWSGGCTGTSPTCTVTMNADTTVAATFVACTITGGPGDDELPGTPGDDVICGLGGQDHIRAGTGNDIVLGGGDGDTIHGDLGDDRLDGGGGGDVLNGGDGVDRLLGGAGGDTLSGGAANDVLLGGGGGDRLVGAAGGDRLTGGLGQDVMNGLAGNDTFYARDGMRDTVDGGAGTDRAQRDKVDRVRLVEKRL